MVQRCNNFLCFSPVKCATVRTGSLYSSHSSAWNKLWNEGGRIDIEGNCSFAQTVHASFYYIISSMPTQELNHNISHKWPFFGICPTSLAQLDIFDEVRF